MGRYTVLGSSQFEARVDADMEVIKQAVSPLDIEGLILMGGYGRGEGTPLQTKEGERPYNDYDLIVVGKRGGAGRTSQLRAQLHSLEKTLTEKLGIPVDLYLQPISSLKSAEFSLMNTELKWGHRVLLGDPNLLRDMPNYAVDKIPLEEGTRLLLNRGTLLLHLVAGLETCSLKYILKNHLSFGDAALISKGCYRISYREKAELIDSIDTDIPNREWIIEAYQRAVTFRHSGDENQFDGWNIEQQLEDTIQNFLMFLAWYESKRLGCQVQSLKGYEMALQDHSGRSFGAFLRNIYHLRHRQPSWRWLCIHPRMRLLPVLMCLLENEDLSVARTLLGCGGDWQALCRTFLKLRERLS